MSFETGRWEARMLKTESYKTRWDQLDQVKRKRCKRAAEELATN